MLSRISLIALALSIAAPMLAASPKEELLAAVNKLGESAGYTWGTKAEGGYFGGVGEGKTLKDGTARIAVNLGDDTYDVIVRGDKGVAKGAGGWASMAELTRDAEEEGMNFSTERFLVSTIGNFKTPAAQAKELCDGLETVNKSDGVYSATLNEETVKRLLSTLRRRSSGDNPKIEVKDPVGTLKCWVRDGTLVRLQVHVQGAVKFNGNERQIDRLSTTEIKDVGKTNVDVPAEAKAKL